jgi:hypothetical protein
VNIGKFTQPQLYNYRYDQLNRLTRMGVFRGLNEAQNQWAPAAGASLTTTTDYHESVGYDANGNILAYYRNAASGGSAMDQLNYFYKSGTNQLDHVYDTAGSCTQV